MLTCLQGNQEGEDKRINTLVSVNLAGQTEAWSLSLLPTLPPRPDWALYLKQRFVFGNYNNKTLPKKVTGLFFFFFSNKKADTTCKLQNKQTLQNAQGFGNIPSFTLNRETSPCSVILTSMGKMAYFLRLIWVCPLQEAENPVATLPT